MSVCLPALNNSAPNGGFLWNFIFWVFSKICRENSNFITYRESYMKSCVNLWYLARFLLHWEIFQTKFVENIKTHVLFLIFSFRQSCHLWDNVEKFGTARQITDDNIIWHMRSACWISKAADTRSEYIIYCFSTATMVTRKHLDVTLYRVFHKSLRDFRTRLRNNQDRHGRKEHINR